MPSAFTFSGTISWDLHFSNLLIPFLCLVTMSPHCQCLQHCTHLLSGVKNIVTHLAYRHTNDSFFIHCYTKQEIISFIWGGGRVTNKLRTKLQDFCLCLNTNSRLSNKIASSIKALLQTMPPAPSMQPTAMSQSISIDLVLNFLLSWLLVLLPSTFFSDVLFSFSPTVSNP